MEDRLNFARELEAHAGGARGFDGQMRALARRDPSEKGHVVVLLVGKGIVAGRDPVVDDVDQRHRLATRQPLGNRHVVNARVLRVLLRQSRFVRMVNGQDRRHVDERREGDANDIVEMQHVCRAGRILYRPRSVIRILQVGPH